jgi:methylenetetrahydrofolate dehydrogenase (NADP+)/methenyltetrahydrofolate cyclohydrolase
MEKIAVTAVLLKGAEVGKRLAGRLKDGLDAEKRRLGRAPVLLLIQIGSASDAEAYARSIRRIAAEVGADVRDLKLDAAAGESALRQKIREAASLPDVAGALLLSPVPAPLNHAYLNGAIPTDRDVEGADPLKTVPVDPPTALSCLELVLASGVPVEGAEAAVIGRSPRVGRPVAALLTGRNATVTVCHSKTRDLAAHVRRADIVVAAAGRPGLVKGEWIKPGAVVVDAGENFVGGKLTGDVEFDKASQRAGFITPVPGGVGPLTTYMLFLNLIALSKGRG